MHKVLLASGLFICSLAAAASTSAQQKENLDAEGHQWWQHAVFYEVY